MNCIIAYFWDATQCTSKNNIVTNLLAQIICSSVDNNSVSIKHTQIGWRKTDRQEERGARRKNWEENAGSDPACGHFLESQFDLWVSEASSGRLRNCSWHFCVGFIFEPHRMPLSPKNTSLNTCIVTVNTGVLTYNSRWFTIYCTRAHASLIYQNLQLKCLVS